MVDLFNQVPCGVLLFHDNGGILKVNSILAEWLGAGAAELEGKTIDTILSLASRIFYNTHFFPLIRLHGRVEEIFLTLVAKDAGDVPVLCNAVRTMQDDSWVNICSFIRVFQRKKYEEEILNARRTAERALKENEALELTSKKLELRTQELDRQYQKILMINQDIVQFSKIVSHDLQEPIRKIKMYSSMLESPGNDDQARMSALQKIQTAADRLAQLTYGLQQYVNIDKEQRRQAVNLNDVLHAAREKVMRARDCNSLELRADRLPTIEGYPVLLELLFYHLLDNAIQFRKPDQQLVVTVSSTLLDENIYRTIPDKYQFLEHVRIIFADNGLGFDGQYNDYVFELIKKIDPRSQGLGIGLALIRKIVDNHGGSVRIESAPGAGTKVFLVLPIRPE